MVIDNTNETIELVLGANVTTSQGDFTCHFNDMSSTTITPSETNGTSNNTTAVTLVGSPSSGSARQLREFVFENKDTATMVVTIRYNNTSVTRTIIKATVQAGDSLYYSNMSGWKVLDSNGLVEFATTTVQPVSNLRTSELFILQNAGNTSAIGAAAMQSLGKAKNAYSSISVRYRLSTIGTSVTWQEMAIYRLAGPNGMGTQQVWYRLGFVDTTSNHGSTGLKTQAITLTGCRPGDDLYLVVAAFATTAPAFQVASIADVNSSNLNSIGVTTTATAWRPSTQPIYQANAFSSVNSSIWFNWTGS